MIRCGDPLLEHPKKTKKSTSTEVHFPFKTDKLDTFLAHIPYFFLKSKSNSGNPAEHVPQCLCWFLMACRNNEESTR